MRKILKYVINQIKTYNGLYHVVIAHIGRPWETEYGGQWRRDIGHYKSLFGLSHILVDYGWLFMTYLSQLRMTFYQLFRLFQAS